MGRKPKPASERKAKGAQATTTADQSRGRGTQPKSQPPIDMSVPSRTIEDRLRIIVADSMCTDDETIRLDTRMAEDLEMDSLDVMDIIMSIEGEFGFDLPDDTDLSDYKTFGDWVRLVENPPKVVRGLEVELDPVIDVTEEAPFL